MQRLQTLVQRKLVFLAGVADMQYAYEWPHTVFMPRELKLEATSMPTTVPLPLLKLELVELELPSATSSTAPPTAGTTPTAASSSPPRAIATRVASPTPIAPASVAASPATTAVTTMPATTTTTTTMPMATPTTPGSPAAVAAVAESSARVHREPVAPAVPEKRKIRRWQKRPAKEPVVPVEPPKARMRPSTAPKRSRTFSAPQPPPAAAAATPSPRPACLAAAPGSKLGCTSHRSGPQTSLSPPATSEQLGRQRRPRSSGALPPRRRWQAVQAAHGTLPDPQGLQSWWP